MIYNLFFAWQSQNQKTYSYLKQQLDSASNRLAERGININIIYSPTQAESGSPDIKSSILEKIKNCDVFLGDLSFIEKDKSISNSNVLYESGIADAFLGEERVILVCDENTKIEQIAFDINHKRISKINTKKEVNLDEWIEVALQEADRQKYVKTYATNQYAEDLLIIINYFVKLSFFNQDLPDKIEFPSISNIESTLNDSVFPYFFLDVNFDSLISDLEDKIMRLNQFSHKRIVWNIINIISKLQEYNNFLFQSRFSYIEIVEEQVQFNIYDSNNFFLKSSDKFCDSSKSVLFLKNSEILIGPNQVIVIDKRINKTNDKHYKRNIVPFSNGQEAQLVIASKLAKIKEESIHIISEIVFKLLLAIQNYLDYCNLHLKYDEGLKTITIVE